MSLCLGWYLEVHGYYDEALSAFSAAVDQFREGGAPESLISGEEKSAFAGLLDQVGWFEFRKGDTERGAAILSKSLEIALEQNDLEILYYIYGNLGYLSLLLGDIAEANRLTTESLKCGKVLNSPWYIAIAVSVLGIVAYQQGNLTEAYQQLTESLKIWRKVGDPRGQVFSMLYLGMTTIELNKIEETRSILLESNAIAKANMDRWAQAFGEDMLGTVALSQGQNEDALGHFTESIKLYKEIGDQLNAMQPTIHLGQTYAALRTNDEAKRLFLEAYANAQENKWTLIILSVLVSFCEMQTDISPVTKLAAAFSVISHPSVTPHLSARSERIRDEILPGLTTEQIETAKNLAGQKTSEEWAREILG